VSFPRAVPGIPPRSAHHELTEDVVYARVDGVPLRYDHYRPLPVRGPAPAVVFVHGGGWSHGDPSHAGPVALRFAKLGIATVSLSYRLVPGHRFPAQVNDVRHGLRWIRAHAEELGIDPSRIALGGISAGAHVALMAHVAPAVPGLEPDLPAELRDVGEEVRALVLQQGPYDLARRAPAAEGTDSIAELLWPRVDDPAWVRLASPVHHAAHVRAPVLLVHGTGDRVVSHRHSERLHEALLVSGRSSELLLLEGAPHAFQIDWHGEANRRSNAAMEAFLSRHLLGGS
jgi:acetyl esterase/lipase